MNRMKVIVDSQHSSVFGIERNKILQFITVETLFDSSIEVLF